jgi:hypothetical protein
MALDFPSSPTDGQISGNYIWSASSGVWKAKPNVSTVVVTSSTVPSSAVDGDLWMNTSDGTMYVYYNDGTSSQWIESRAPITADGYTSPNYIINGGMDIWQRGTSFTTTASFAADRWKVGSDTGFTVSRQAFAADELTISSVGQMPYYLRHAKNSGGTWLYFSYQVEDVQTLAGQVVTMSFYAKANSAQTLKLQPTQFMGSGGTGGTSSVAQNVSITTSWQRYTMTFTLPTLAGKTVGSGSSLYWQFEVSSTAAVTFDITGVQLESGSVATAFRRNANSIQGELAACQRYYEKSYNLDVAPGASTSIGRIYGSGSAPTTGFLSHSFIFKVTKRGTPVVVCYDSNGLINAVNRDYIGTGTSAGNAVSIPATVTSTSHFLAYSSGTYNATALSAHFTSDAEL